MKRYGPPKLLVTDRLRSDGAAMKVIGVVDRQVCGQWLNNRAENSHQPFRRRERAMARFRDIKTLQKFAAAQASIHNHFNHDRHFICSLFPPASMASAALSPSHWSASSGPIVRRAVRDDSGLQGRQGPAKELPDRMRPWRIPLRTPYTPGAVGTYDLLRGGRAGRAAPPRTFG